MNNIRYKIIYILYITLKLKMLNRFQWSCRLHSYHWTAHTRDGLLQSFGDFICTGPECHICSKHISISTATFSITTATLCKPYCQFWRYQTTKHRANRNSGEVRLKLCYMIFHYSYISVKNKSNNKTTEHKYRQQNTEGTR